MQIRKKGGWNLKKNLLLWNYLKNPKFELYKHNDELFNIYYGIFYELWTFAYFDKNFFKFHPPFFLICIIGQNRQKFQIHKKSRNIG
jgi:hypothetical protein